MRVYRSSLIIVCILLSTVLLNELVVRYQFNGSEKLVSAFSQTTFQMEEAALNIWGEYPPKYMREEEMALVVAKVADILGLSEYETSFSETTEGEDKTYLAKKQAKEAITSIKFVETIERTTSETYKVHNYLVVDIKLMEKCNSILYYETLIRDAFKEFSMKPVINLTMTASTNREVLDDEATIIMENIVESLNGEVNARHDLGNVKTIYGYSKNVEGYVLSQGDKVNLDLAVTYDETQGKTYLYGAIPVITIEY